MAVVVSIVVVKVVVGWADLTTWSKGNAVVVILACLLSQSCILSALLSFLLDTNCGAVVVLLLVAVFKVTAIVFSVFAFEYFRVVFSTTAPDVTPPVGALKEIRITHLNSRAIKLFNTGKVNVKHGRHQPLTVIFAYFVKFS